MSSEETNRNSVSDKSPQLEFTYAIQENKKVTVSWEGVEFTLSLKEIFALRRTLQNALFDGSVIFGCKIDEPECY